MAPISSIIKLLALWCFCLKACVEGKSCGKPNIIFILADDLGVGDTSIPAYAVASPPYQINTPNLERMARDGVVFTQAYTPAPVCGPSRYSILSGRHTGHSMIRGNTGIGEDYHIPCGWEEEDILAKMLKENGYNTAIIGKWGFENHPFECGFDKFYGQLSHIDAHTFFPDEIYDNVISQPNIRHTNLKLPKNEDADEAKCQEAVEECDFSHDLFTKESIKYIEEQAKQDAPFFLFLSYSTPHVGAWKPLRKLERHKDKLHKVAPRFSCPDELHVSEDVYKIEECRHKGAVENYLDRDVGVILDLLDEFNIMEDTIVAFAADNGPDFSVQFDGKYVHRDTFMSSGLRRGQKRELYEGGILTPFIIQWKGKIRSNYVSNKLTSLTDLFSTFLEASGSEKFMKHPEVVDSISLLAMMAGENRCQNLQCCSLDRTTEHEYLYWEYCDRQVYNWKRIRKNPRRFCSEALHSKDGWKLVWDFSKQSHFLYEVKTPLLKREFEKLEREDVVSDQKYLEMQNAIENSRIPLEDLGYKGGPRIEGMVFTHAPSSSSPTSSPSPKPTTKNPTIFPTTLIPTRNPTLQPSYAPTKYPTGHPTSFPINTPSMTFQKPTKSPITPDPTRVPTHSPSTNVPTPFTLRYGRCEPHSHILTKTRVNNEESCIRACENRFACEYYSYSAQCRCCELYQTCESPRRKNPDWLYQDWLSGGIAILGQTQTPSSTLNPTLEPTSSPVNPTVYPRAPASPHPSYNPTKNPSLSVGSPSSENPSAFPTAAILVSQNFSEGDEQQKKSPDESDGGAFSSSAIAATLAIVMLSIVVLLIAKYKRSEKAPTQTQKKVKDEDDGIIERQESSDNTTDESFESCTSIN